MAPFSNKNKQKNKYHDKHHHSYPDNPNSNKNNPIYSEEQAEWIQNIYFIGILFWIILIIGLKIFPTNNIVEFLILLVPIVLLLISFKSIPHISDVVENFMFQANILTLGLLVAFPILTWIYKRSKINRGLFLSIIGTAIIFSVLSLFDVGVPHKFLPLVKHVKSILQTFALALFIFAIYRFVMERKHRDVEKGKVQDIY